MAPSQFPQNCALTRIKYSFTGQQTTGVDISYESVAVLVCQKTLRWPKDDENNVVNGSGFLPPRPWASTAERPGGPRSGERGVHRGRPDSEPGWRAEGGKTDSRLGVTHRIQGG